MFYSIIECFTQRIEATWRWAVVTGAFASQLSELTKPVSVIRLLRMNPRIGALLKYFRSICICETLG